MSRFIEATELTKKATIITTLSICSPSPALAIPTSALTRSSSIAVSVAAHSSRTSVQAEYAVAHASTVVIA